jgi:hypothetical protein
MRTGQTLGKEGDLLVEFMRAYKKHEEANEKPEDRIGAWVGHDREFRQAVALVRACLGKWGYKLESPTANQAQHP